MQNENDLYSLLSAFVSKLEQHNRQIAETDMIHFKSLIDSNNGKISAYKNIMYMLRNDAYFNSFMQLYKNELKRCPYRHDGGEMEYQHGKEE